MIFVDALVARLGGEELAITSTLRVIAAPQLLTLF